MTRALAARRHGRRDARIRPDARRDLGTVQLRPGAGWPPEIDHFGIFETRARRDQMMTTTHLGTAGQHEVEQSVVRADFTSVFKAS